jgi:hypothetical protein
MAAATEYYEADGWAVTDVSTKKPYDLVCVKSGMKHELRVEVKVTTSSGTQVELTAGEVANAEIHPQVALVVVSESRSAVRANQLLPLADNPRSSIRG